MVDLRRMARILLNSLPIAAPAAKSPSSWPVIEGTTELLKGSSSLVLSTRTIKKRKLLNTQKLQLKWRSLLVIASMRWTGQKCWDEFVVLLLRTIVPILWAQVWGRTYCDMVQGFTNPMNSNTVCWKIWFVFTISKKSRERWNMHQQVENVTSKIMHFTTCVVTVKLKVCPCDNLWKNLKYVMSGRKTMTFCIFSRTQAFTVIRLYWKVESIVQNAPKVCVNGLMEMS